jgi:ssDNA thymidine ADP-ribosyltransferase, DarT
VSVTRRARERGVTEILHYTSERGVMGSVMKGELLSREQVENDDDVAFIFEGIWERKDPDWVDYISLSVSRINADLYRRSRKNFPDYWWAVLSFDVAILDHDDVWFTTTNNSHPPCERGQRIEGFEAMFGSPIEWGWYGTKKWRNATCPDAWPTDRAAEVLYPTRIPLSFLQKVYVPGKQHRRMVDAWAESFAVPELPVEVNLEPFS